MAGTLGSRFTIGLGLMLVIIASLLVVSCGGGNSATTPPTPPAPSPVVPGSAFTGSVILGSPSSTRVVANVYSADQSGTVYIAWGGTSGSYTSQTSSVTLNADQPLELTLNNLTPDADHFYRLYFKAKGSDSFSASDEARFHTARTAGSTFTFTLQGDSHPEREKTMFNPTLYARTLATAAADQPDFHICMGDDFSVDTLNAQTINASQVRGRYTLQRPWLGAIGRQAPVFLVNGNHEQAARYLLDGTPNNVAVWAQTARNSLYTQPAPDSFYSGNVEQVPFIGLLRNYFAWTWGDALFVVIDPYWSSPVPVDEPLGGGTKHTNAWDFTHGDAQYQWLKQTLEQSKAKYKFVFAHHVMGTGRGGVEVASLWEWGGKDASGKDVFSAQRPSWVSTIHQLMVKNGVTIFFQGHDHVWARQSLNGVTYQTLSVPADPNYGIGFGASYLSGDVLPSSGYTRVTVSPQRVKVDYVRTYLSADETSNQRSGSVAFSYTLP
jgi:hypothetical protein